jgi:hypothetical protein
VVRRDWYFGKTEIAKHQSVAGSEANRPEAIVQLRLKLSVKWQARLTTNFFWRVALPGYFLKTKQPRPLRFWFGKS